MTTEILNRLLDYIDAAITYKTGIAHNIGYTNELQRKCDIKDELIKLVQEHEQQADQEVRINPPSEKLYGWRL